MMGRRGQWWEEGTSDGKEGTVVGEGTVMGRRGQWWEGGDSDGKEGTVVWRRGQ